jgi:hypothetical protein
MGTGPDHYREAERLLAGRTLPATEDGTETFWVPATADDIAAAQAHATLALAAATALPLQRMILVDPIKAWSAAIDGAESTSEDSE